MATERRYCDLCAGTMYTNAEVGGSHSLVYGERGWYGCINCRCENDACRGDCPHNPRRIIQVTCTKCGGTGIIEIPITRDPSLQTARTFSLGSVPSTATTFAASSIPSSPMTFSSSFAPPTPMTFAAPPTPILSLPGSSLQRSYALGGEAPFSNISASSGVMPFAQSGLQRSYALGGQAPFSTPESGGFGFGGFREKYLIKHIR